MTIAIAITIATERPKKSSGLDLFAIAVYCYRKTLYCCKMLTGSVLNVCLGRYPSDFPLTFEALQHITIADAYNNEPNSEHMQAGKNKGESKKRFLISFDSKKITRRAIVHSAKLYLFLMDFGVSSVEDEAARSPSNSLEVYQIISTDWYPGNTTSVIPWHQDYLGIGKDVANNRYV